MQPGRIRTVLGPHSVFLHAVQHPRSGNFDGKRTKLDDLTVGG
jgi:hypothetical protein